MQLTTRHHLAAQALWECGGRVEEAAARRRLRAATLRRWLAEPDFRALVAQGAAEPLLQATNAMTRWAPVAVARLIQDLEGESPADARQAAREILRLALDIHRELSRPPDAPPNADPAESGDPLSRRVAGLTDDQLARMLAILNGDAPARPNPDKEVQP
jgi:hypothetical protein